MVARSVVTLGVSTERGAVHAVALADGGKLSERVVLHRTEQTHGDTKADMAAAVEAVLEGLAAELGPDREVGGVAVTYRDAAERRAIVTRLAAGRWHTASMVSAKSAHLSVTSMMTWLDEFDNLLVCEVVPGYQAFTLVDRGRRRVLAAVGRAGGANATSLGAAVRAASDQLELAATKPNAVVIIGSAGRAPAVLAAVRSFRAPVIPCRMAAFAAAAGAAASAQVEVDKIDEPVAEERRVRSATALFAAAGVLAGGMLVGGFYAMNGFSGPTSAAVAADARATAGGWLVDGAGPAGVGAGEQGPARHPEVAGSFDESTAGARDPFAFSQDWDDPQEDGPVPLEPADPDEAQTNSSTALVPGAGTPTVTEVGPPNGVLLFPGETPPPAAFTPEAADWWDKHLRTMAQWGTQQVR
ncbi:hypothetical protein AB0C34_28625 [Nocardia sp. NPDC049220]|uniref:hypothetical protein n=1 Tax=Nocardia sp. NPDC049220 TaxID=3155273 RepID=UPI0033CEC41D